MRHPPIKGRTLQERFWLKVNKDGPTPPLRPDLGPCWIWTASRHAFGYGYFGISKGDIDTAHRVSWTLNVGPIPDGQSVLHHCDNPPCVNPAHLFLGTQLDNNIDATLKRRVAHGECHHWSKLSPEIARAVRAMSDAGVSRKEIATCLKISIFNVRDILQGRAWRAA